MSESKQVAHETNAPAEFIEAVEEMDSVADEVVEVKADEPPPIQIITLEEQERRDLQRRFKKIFGYKPITKDLEELRHVVAAAEHRLELKHNGVI